MFEVALVSFATFFATVGPPDVAIVFAALTSGERSQRRHRLALKAVLVAGAILLFFAVVGRPVLHYLDISLAAMRAAGGILLLLIAIDLVFARDSGGISTTPAEADEARRSPDVSVFPIAMPLIAGPGTIGAVILLVADTEGDALAATVVVGALAAVLLVTFFLMLAAGRVQRVLGVTGVHVLARVFGILLAALAVQFTFDGIRDSGLMG